MIEYGMIIAVIAILVGILVGICVGYLVIRGKINISPYLFVFEETIRRQNCRIRSRRRRDK